LIPPAAIDIKKALITKRTILENTAEIHIKKKFLVEWKRKETTKKEYEEYRKALVEEKIGIRMLTPEEVEQLKKEGRLKALYEV